MKRNGPATAQIETPTAERVTSTDGTELAVRRWGSLESRPIVFFHGYTQNYAAWSEQIGALTDRFQLVAVDLRGHGDSDKPLDTSAYQNGDLWAADVYSVLTQLRLERPVLVGWSYSSFVLADYLRVYGEKDTAGVVLIGGGSQLGTPSAFAHFGPASLQFTEGSLSHDLMMRLEATIGIVEGSSRAPLETEQLARRVGVAMTQPVEARIGMFSRQVDFRPVWQRSRLPILLVHGSEDAIILPSAAQEIASLASDADLLLYDGAGHMPFRSQATRFNRDFADFVTRVNSQ